MAFEVDISQAHDGLIDKLKDLCGLESEDEVIKEALVMMGWAALEAGKGHEICAIDTPKNEMRVLKIPFLEAARKAARQGTDTTP